MRAVTKRVGENDIPGAHRHADPRYCGAGTVVVGQSTVYVNNRLWAVEGDPNTHVAGPLKAIYPPRNIYINQILIIVAPGDTASGADMLFHPPGPVDPAEGSDNVIAYGGRAGGSA
jgi:hypothetical protein